MHCPKCQQENPETAQFCLRCHSPLHYTCPTCRHVQDHGGKCDECGLDFLKYATVMVFQNQALVDRERERLKARSSLAKQILLLPITGGWSLLKYLFTLGRDG